ncbi:MAG: ergothioneine biosynthesis protein EgtB [Solirubrobacteraceae bacterium]
MNSQIAAAAPLDGTCALEALWEARQQTLALVAPVSDGDLERVHSKLMSPISWDLGHIAAFEDLWLAHRFGGRPLLHEKLAHIYDAFETPRAGRGELPFLRPAAARKYLAQVRARTTEVTEKLGIGDGFAHEMVTRHEQQHGETMLQTLALARLADYEPAGLRADPPTASPAPTGLEMIELPAARCTLGAPPHGFAYDNERPRHEAEVPAYEIGRSAVTNGSYLSFVEGGGYERPELWCDQGWAWKQEHDVRRPGAWSEDLTGEWTPAGLRPLDPHRPVVHVSWFEADAFARAHGARLPTELEWEHAATWSGTDGLALDYPWGEQPPVPGVHANVGRVTGGPAPAGAYPAGASPSGCLGMVGDVWEWTSSDFGAYPGFVPYPYKEYSQVFFGPEHKVLRGGSWATCARLITPTFRNWDLPQRRQIFAGLRVARDARR